MTENELKAVLAHEIGHIANRDCITAAHIIAINAGFFTIFRIGLNMLTSNSNSKDNGKAKGAFVVIGLGLASVVIGTLFRYAISREREFAADTCSVALTGSSKYLASALKKIEQQGEDKIKNSVLHNTAHALSYSHSYINNPTDGFAYLFSSHPPVKNVSCKF